MREVVADGPPEEIHPVPDALRAPGLVREQYYSKSLRGPQLETHAKVSTAMKSRPARGASLLRP